MNVEEQRRLGVKLTSTHCAPKTLEIIKNTSSLYGDIFRSAADELGADRLADIVLESGEPSWAWGMLRHVQGIDAHRDALLRMGAPMDECRTRAAVDFAAPTLGRIAAFELDVVGGASYSAYFTMYWFTAPNVIEPAASYAPATPPYKWSYEVLVGQSATNLCKYFALSQAPLRVGDTVWMTVDVCGGGWYDSGYLFTYDPAGDTAVISADGGTVTAFFTWTMKV